MNVAVDRPLARVVLAGRAAASRAEARPLDWIPFLPLQERYLRSRAKFRPQPSPQQAQQSACVWLTEHTGPPSEPIGEPVQNPRANATAYIFWRDYGRQGKSLIDLRVDHHHAKVDKQAIRRMEKNLSDGRCRPEEENQMRRASVRGLLCAPCNKGLGHARESVERLRTLSSFLRKWQDRHKPVGSF